MTKPSTEHRVLGYAVSAASDTGHCVKELSGITEDGYWVIMKTRAITEISTDGNSLNHMIKEAKLLADQDEKHFFGQVPNNIEENTRWHIM